MELSAEILSNITTHMKYAKYMPMELRRENWQELVSRNEEMHVRKYPQLEDEIREAYKFVYAKKVLPSMRALQFSGKPIEITPSRIFNCAYTPADDWRTFSEIMFLLLGGTGVGYSVQKHHVEKLPDIVRPNEKRTRRYLIGDSIEGWADSIKILMRSYFFGGSKIRFDFSDIRKKGAMLVTSGGKAPGPQPLKECLLKVEGILDEKQNGSKLTTLETHDIICHIADAVLAGGIRRAALIALFSADDDDIISCKTGNWWELNSQRGRANNSAVLLRHKISEEFFLKLWTRIRQSGSGEPGVYFSNDKNMGTNPCCEISLKAHQFCNLTEVNASDVVSLEDLCDRVRVGAFIGTLQAGYTDFHYLREKWKRTTERDALIGVSMTGIASGQVTKLDMKLAASVVKTENARVAKIIGINVAARTTCVKPAGTTSLVLGTSSGIHAWHDEYYLRRLRVGKNEAIYQYLVANHPALIEDCERRPHDTAILHVPIKAPDGATTRNESALHLLQRVKKVSLEWVKTGHCKGSNTNNVSATISVREHEWEEVGNWMWKNRDSYNGLSILPFSDHSYVQAPFESISKRTYEILYEDLQSVNLDHVIEYSDNTDLSGEIACGAGGCDVI